MRSHLEKKQLFESHLDDYLPPRLAVPAKIAEAMTHSMHAPGKRLRPVLFLMLGEGLSLAPERILPAAVGMEMVHTSSLILDDLPMMDDATERRGRPCLHIVFGEATAVLAAQALLVQALALLSRNCVSQGLPSQEHHQAIQIMVETIGLSGMIAGQQADLDTWYADDVSAVDVKRIHELKTGALFRALSMLAGILARVPGDHLARLESFGRAFGLAFQIQDDLADYGAEESANLARVLGPDRAQVMLQQALERAGRELRALDLLQVESIFPEIFGKVVSR